MPKVSIVIPIYNVENYLLTCLNSVVNQTLEDIEIICVNDGSTDNSLSILEEFAKKDNRIKVISKQNSGYGHTMNLGIDKSNGDYIGIVEPDDCVALDMYEILYKKATEHDLDFIKADYCKFEGEGFEKEKESVKFSYIELSKDKSYYNRIVNPQEDIEPFNFVMNTWAGIYKRAFIEKYNIQHNESPGASFQDNGFWFQTLSLARKIYFLNEPFYLKRNDNFASSVKSKGKVFTMCEEYEFIRNFLDNNPKIKEDSALKSKFTEIYQKRRFGNYLVTLDRIDKRCRGIFLQKFHEDFSLAEKNKELNKELFSKKSWYFLQLIINNPKRFNRKYFTILYIFNKAKLHNVFSFLSLVKKSKGNPKKIHDRFKASKNSKDYKIKQLKLFDNYSP